MGEWNCDVIRDLLPSYLDEICSDTSRKIVDEHLAGCSSCRDLVEQMQSTMFVSEKTQRKEIDYMRKVRQKIGGRSRILLAMFALVLIVGLCILMWRYGDVAMELYYVVQPVLTIGAYLAFSVEWRHAERARWKWGGGAAGLVVACYSILLLCSVTEWIQADVLPFGIQASSLGPFVYRQLLAGVFAQTVLFLFAARISTRSGNACPLLFVFHITGGCIALAMNSLLKNMNTLEGFKEQMFRGLAVLIGEGCVLTVLLLFLERRRRQEAE